jgi:hypothetical protein
MWETVQILAMVRLRMVSSGVEGDEEEDGAEEEGDATSACSEMLARSDAQAKARKPSVPTRVARS